MEEIGISVSKEAEEVDTKSFLLSSQYEQLENDDLYTKFKVINKSEKLKNLFTILPRQEARRFKVKK